MSTAQSVPGPLASAPPSGSTHDTIAGVSEPASTTRGKPGTYYAHERPELGRLIDAKPGNVVLDLGCASGALSAAIRRQGRADEIWGVEVMPDVADEARHSGVFHKVLTGDVERLVAELPPDHFTHVVAGDVLEHLVDPWETLRRLRPKLRPGGRIICSLPNIRNLSFISKLLFGRTFAYRDSGVLDRTHLRFFARKDVLAMFENAGFVNVRIAPARPKSGLGYRLGVLTLGDLVVKVLLVTAERPA